MKTNRHDMQDGLTTPLGPPACSPACGIDQCAGKDAGDPRIPHLDQGDILAWLREEDPVRLETLWRMAEDTRRANVGDAVHLRGLVEISNHCVRQCAYCGLRAGNRSLLRYRMEPNQIFDAALQALGFGYGSVVLQAGEDFGLHAEWVAGVVQRIKSQTPLAVTLSLGERSDADLACWREAGADRYLLRFETSDRALFDRIHPGLGEQPTDRIAMLGRLKQLGYQVGSGIMVGIPGQSCESVARDICLFRELDLDMIGIGPFIPHPGTPLGNGKLRPEINGQQVPATEEMVYKTVALTRMVRPDANIPSTSALATINKRNGRELGLQRGANVVMPNLTPVQYRRLYQIYPAKACIDETADACSGCLTMRIAALGRHAGRGPGGRPVTAARGAEVSC